MLGAVAIFWFFAAAFAMAIACCGKDPRAKLVSAYLLCTWLSSNQIFHAGTMEEVMDAFSAVDIVAAMVLYIALMRWRSVWLATIVAALFVQVGLQAYYLTIDAEFRNDYRAILLNNLLYGVQLVAVASPTLFKPSRRRRAAMKRGRRANRINPPYEGWEPPPDYRVRAANE